MHALLDARRRALGDAEQLDAVAKLAGGGNVGQRDRLDALDKTASASTSVPKARAARIASLCAVSKPPMSKDGIGLGIAELLRLGQTFRRTAAAPAPSA